jgi:drug/metabolite transporter (DMT)-like permease
MPSPIPSETAGAVVVQRAAANLRGIGWMLVTGLLFVIVTGIVRHLGTDMSAIQAAFLRYVFGLILISPVLIQQFRHGAMPRRMGLYAARGLVHGIAVILWFVAMARIPIAQVTALGYTAPIFVAIGAALFLGETLRARRIGAILVAFAGALVIVRPGFEEVSLGALAQLTAAPLFAASFILAKKLTQTEDSSVIVAYLSIFVTLVLLPPALYVWRTPTWEELAWLFLTAVTATIGHYTLTRALQAADLAVTQPVSFLQLVWATLLGFYVFGEEPDVWTWLGGGIIVASATYIAHRESRGRRKPKPPAG